MASSTVIPSVLENTTEPNSSPVKVSFLALLHQNQVRPLSLLELIKYHICSCLRRVGMTQHEGAAGLRCGSLLASWPFGSFGLSQKNKRKSYNTKGKDLAAKPNQIIIFSPRPLLPNPPLFPWFNICNVKCYMFDGFTVVWIGFYYLQFTLGCT